MKKPILHLTRARHCVESLSRYFFVSPFFHLQKRQRPPRSDGGCCEKGVPSSGEKIASTVLRSP